MNKQNLKCFRTKAIETIVSFRFCLYESTKIELDFLFHIIIITAGIHTPHFYSIS